MSTLSLRLPDSLHEEVKSLVKTDGTSINQFITSAVDEKISALLTEKYLEKRAKVGNTKEFLEAMSKIPDVGPVKQDKL